ncbi:MAG: type I glutamate--ammonia ligase [Planctomycetota bacterium]
MNAEEIRRKIRDEKVEVVDLRFMDLLGTWHHFSVPANQLKESAFEEGFGFDGSSIRGWQSINESDMLVVPDPATAVIDPFLSVKTLAFICDVRDPITGFEYEKDPRQLAARGEKYLASTGIADICYIGPECEFFIFDNIRFDQTAFSGYYYIDSEEGSWNTGSDKGPNLGHRPRQKEGYFPLPPVDSHQDIRSEMLLTMQACGIEMECQHHEVATGGQAEIDMKYAPLRKMADNVAWYKYITKNVAWRHNKSVTFMPKPLFGDNGTGMHTHVSLWKGERNLFAGDGYAGLSDIGKWAIGGILLHAPSLVAITNPTTNSYKRLVPGYEAPVNLAYSSRNRSAAVRIPMLSTRPETKRLEFRCPDPTANPYLAFTAIMMAAIDGIQRKIDPGPPLDKNIYDLPPEELASVPSTPGSLGEAMENLEKDHEYLLKGDVFSENIVRTWIHYKRTVEIDAIRIRPHPYEFSLYYDA